MSKLLSIESGQLLSSLVPQGGEGGVDWQERYRALQLLSSQPHYTEIDLVLTATIEDLLQTLLGSTHVLKLQWASTIQATLGTRKMEGRGITPHILDF